MRSHRIKSNRMKWNGTGSIRSIVTGEWTELESYPHMDGYDHGSSLVLTGINIGREHAGRMISKQCCYVRQEAEYTRYAAAMLDGVVDQ
jgi:hypothetical protein